MSKNYFWQGENVRLRLMRVDDWRVLLEESIDSSGLQGLEPGIPLPDDEDKCRRWVERTISDEADSTLWFSIEDYSGKLVGSANIHGRDDRNGTFSFMIRIFRPYRGRGYAQEAVRIMLRYCFYELRYQKANSETIDLNVGSIHLHHSLGFKEEGRRRRNVFTGGQYHDELLFGLTREEFDEMERERAQGGSSVSPEP